MFLFADRKIILLVMAPILFRCCGKNSKNYQRLNQKVTYQRAVYFGEVALTGNFHCFSDGSRVDDDDSSHENNTSDRSDP